MKKPTFSRAVYTVLILLLSLTAVAQNFVTPTIRKNIELKGDMLLIGNSILGKDNNPLNDNSSNENISMVNIDIDGDPSTINSSSADLKVPNTTTCFRIAYAALYWGSILQTGSRTDINKVKLKLPGSSTYTSINGSIIYDANVAPIVPDDNKPYACYADVTSLLNGLANPQGTYTVADVLTSVGTNGQTGLAAGWTLFVIYEDPKATMKSITTFDGFSALYDGKTLGIPISGFLTPPTGSINLKFGFASLNGDKPATGSKVEISNGSANGTAITTPQRPSNSFFNSSITDTSGYFTNRNPNGTNSLGYDTGIEQLLDVNKSTIDHNANSALVTLQVAKGQANPIFSFFNAFEVDVIAPDIQLTKVVKNASNVDIGGTNVGLGDYLFYEISYQNIGNDNVTGISPNPTMIIKDVLPKNIIFNYPADLSSIDLTNSGGATVKSYDQNTRTIIFSVPNTSVEVGDPIYKIRLKVQVVPDCNSLSDACSNEIKNQAFASYRGVINTDPVVEEGSFASTVCNFGTGTSTNFLVGIDNCKFTKKFILCNTSVVLSASNGYDSYVWSNTLNGPSIGTGQTYTATQTGTYYVRSTSSSTCKSIDEEITVVPFGNTVTNPVIPYAQAPYAGSVVTCTINGKSLPNIFLCGANDVRAIKTGITDATSIIWSKLNENGTCPAATSTTICANESASCSWSQVGTGPDYNANTAGQFKLTINYTGGCFSIFYFNVFQNLLNPTAKTRDITCNTKGQITVNGIPASGYEFSLDNNGTGAYQSSNVFDNVAAGFHYVYIRQIGVTNGCLFKTPQVYIQNRTYQVNVNVTQPTCNGGKGSVTIQANNVLPQYYFSIYQGATKVDAVGPLNANDYTFSNLNAGTYTVRVWTDDGCDYSENIDIINPPLFTATAVLTKALTCTDGLITVNTFNGTSPFKYYVNSTTTFQSTNQITVTNPLPTGGVYNIDVSDSKGCIAKTSITVVATPAPVYTISPTNVLCYGDATGAIQFNVTSNTGGYTLSYSIDGGTTYSTNPVFSGLVAGTVYTPKLRYTLDDVNYCYDTKPTVTLTGPSAALTASAGVSELAGCGPNGEGKIRITNPQGGVAPYLYSFDNQQTWIISNEAYKMPGTYTVYIKDANGCIYAMPNIIIDPKPVAPTIDISSPVFNCDGTANTTATVTNSGSASYQYGYLIDNKVNTNVPSNIFVNVPSGPHTVSVTYTLISVPTYSNLLKEDFGRGPDTTSPGINSAYCWEKQDGNTLAFANCSLSDWHPWLMNDGDYVVTKALLPDHFNDFNWWLPKDHTAVLNNTPSITDGRFLAVNIGATIPIGAVLYSKPINDVIPNQPINVSLYMTNLLKITNNLPSPQLRIQLVKGGTVIASQAMPSIPRDEKWHSSTSLFGSLMTLNPGNNTSLDFQIISNSQVVTGNDLAIDDIEVYQLPKSCLTQVDFPFEVPTGKAFSGSVSGFKDITCAGANNGEITITAQNFDPVYGFDYSINGGTTWVNSKVSPVIISGLSANTYTPRLRYSAAGTCPLTLTPVTIKNPTVLTVTANVTTQATCTTGASITASANGGTPAYLYELRQSDGVTVVTGFNTNAVFTNVAAGSYKVFAKDANGCITSVGFGVSVVAPPTLSAAIDPTTNLCFDPTTGANIVVKITGGVAPFIYTTTFNGGTPSAASSTFAGPTFTYNATVKGTYAFDVYDANGCKAPTVTQTINDKLTVVTPVTTALDCDVAPANQAVITGTISEGTAPFAVTLVSGPGPGTLVQPVGNGTTFTYTTAVAGTYKFQIKDANNCVATSDAIINSLFPITLGSTDVNPKCNGSSDGSVQLNPSGGAGGFTYSNDGGANYTNVSFYSGLSAGTPYTFYVKDSNKCTKSITVTLTAPVAVTATAAITTAYTCDNPAVISVTSVSGGTAPYNFTLNRGGVAIASNTTGVFNNISVAGSYTVTVTDSNSCSFTTTPPLTITALNPATNPAFSERPISCKTGESTSDVTVSVTGGTLPLKYETIVPSQIIKGQQTSGTFTGLTPGTYTFKVTDANNCSVTGVYKVDDVLPVVVNGSVVSNISCLNSTDGKLSFTVSGNSGTFSYVLKNSLNVTIPNTQSTQSGNIIDFTGLAADTYKITITNPTTGCTATKSLTVAAPTAVLALDPTTLVDVTCNAKGSAVINAKGGWGSYTYAVTPTNPAGATISQNNKTFTNLSAGDYSFTVTDLNGCQVTGTFTIKDKVLPTASIDATSIYCAGGAGATLKVTPNAQTNYTYTLGGTVQNNGTFSGLAPGKYTIRVTDTSTGCYIDLPEQTIALPLTASTKLLADLDCEVPPASPDASIEVTINDGYPNYSYKVNQTGAPFTGAVNPVTGAVFTYTAATAGTYYFEITDSKGCTTVVSRTINTLVKPTIALAVPAAVKCNGGSTGTITVTPSAVGSYTYVLTPTAPTGPVVSQSTNVFSNLKAGQYDVVIIDAKNCSSAAVSVTVSEPVALAASAALKTALKCGAGNAPQAATIEVTATDGTPFVGLDQYRYDYGDGNGFVTSNTFISSTSGATINITVKDANGCTVTTSATVNAFNPPSGALAFAQANLISCDATKLDTDLKLTVTNGVAPFTFEITSTDAATPPTTTVANGILTQDYTFADLLPGTYNFKVTDVNGCTITGQYKIDDVKKLTVTAVKLSDNKCINVDGGSAKFTVANNTGALTVSLINSTSGSSYTYASLSGNVYTYTNLPVGDYTFTAVDGTTKCSKDGTVTINNPAGITIATPVATKVFCSKPSSTITISATGGTGTLYYAVVKQGVTPLYPTDYNTTGIFSKNTVTDATLIYDVYVQDANGCPKQTTVTVPHDNAPTVNPISDLCYPGSPFTITVSGTVYTGSATQYGIGTTTTNIVYNGTASKTISAPGIYYVGIKDDNGCEATTSFTVSGQLIITPKLDKDLTCTTVPPTATAAQITLSSVGGNGSYNYEFSTDGISYTGFAGNVYNPATAGDYYFRVSSGGCSAATAVPVKVTNPVNPDITSVIQTQFIKCSGDETAAIKINLDLTKGIPGFVFKVERYPNNTYTDPADFNYGTQTTGLAAGFYKVTVTDAKGCTDTDYIEIKGKDPINFTLDKIDIQCTGGAYTLGSIMVKDVTGGTAPFKYFISNNYGDVIAGNPYTTTIAPDFREDYTFSNIINFGIYTVNVVDANGCSFSKQITMTSPPSDLKVDIDTSTPTCSNGMAIVTVKASPLGSNYTFGIFETNVPPFSSNFYPPNNGGDSHIFSGLTPGVTYTFVVHDGDTGCDFVNTAGIPIPAASALVPTITPHNVTCIGQNDGYVSFALIGYDPSTTSIDYQVFAALSNAPVSGVLTHNIGDPFPVNYPALPALPAPQVGNLSPSQYYIVFTERGGVNDGCKLASKVFDIKESSIELSVDASVYKNENCKDLGIITAEAKDGTGPYQYLVNTTNIIPTANTSGWQTSNTFNLAANISGESYYVFAKDANGCIKPATAAVTLLKDPDPVFALTVPNKCAGEGNFAVDVTITDSTPSMAPYSASVNTSSFVSFSGLTYAATGLNSGTQTIIIQDKNGCPVTHTIDINATPTATAEVSPVLVCTPPTVANATITVTIDKGTQPYTYQAYKNNATVGGPVTLNATDVTFNYPVASADFGTYKFLITDANSCPIETNEVIVDPIVPIVPDFKATQSLCNGGSGTIELSATGGKGLYTYDFNGSGVFSDQTIYTMTAGTYPFIVKDALGCIANGSAVLGEPTLVTLNALVPGITLIQPTCGPVNAAVDAKVVLSATGGTGTYTYSFDGSTFDGQDTYLVSQSRAGVAIPYSVKDGNGCIDTGSVTIDKLDPPVFDLNAFTQSTVTCKTPTSDVQVVSTNGFGGVTYSIVSPASETGNITGATSGNFTGLPAGDYIFQVTDSKGCMDQVPYTVKDVIKINIALQSTTGITCSAATDGKASFFISGYGSAAPGTYHYILDTNPPVTGLTAATINLIGLTSGNHTITVYDDVTDCSMALPLGFKIAAPPAPLTISKVVTPRGCTTFGAVVVTGHDGWGNYTYTLTPPTGLALTNTDGIFNGLTDLGHYDISVSDANGCPATDSFDLVAPTPPIATVDLVSDYCYDTTNAATLVVKASAGVAPYLFSIDNGVTFLASNSLPLPNDTYTFNGLTPGSYDIVVQDAYGCKSVVPVNTVIKPQLFAKAENIKDIFCTVGNENGTIRISAQGGYGSYSYTVTKDTDPTSAPIAFGAGLDTVDYSVTASGSYVFVVTDAKGCSYTITNAVVMVDPTPVTFTAVPTSPSCTGSQGNMSDGSILVTLGPANDNPDYTYTIVRTSPAGFTATQVNNGLFTGLTAGDYSITVTSAKGCSTPDTVTINPPAVVTASASAPAFSCTVDPTKTVVTVVGGGGTGTYTFSKDGVNYFTSNSSPTADNKYAFDLVDDGTTQNPTYWVKDSNGCVQSTTLPAPIDPLPKLTSVVATNGPAMDCINNQQVMNVVITGGSNTPNPFTYQVYQDGVVIPGGPVTVTGNKFTYNAPAAGHYYEFEVFDNNTNCSLKSTAYDVPLFNKASVIASASANAKCNGDANGAIEINITGYSGKYDYEILKGGVSLVPPVKGIGDSSVASSLILPQVLAAGTDYTVKVTETAYPSCTITSKVVTITEPTVLDLTPAITVVNQNCNTSGAVITVPATSVTGGTAGYMYAFVPAGSPTTGQFTSSNTKTIATTQISPAFDAIDVWVQDANGCQDHVTVNISRDPMPMITSVVPTTQCPNAAGTYDINVTASGVGALEYSLDGNSWQSSNVLTVSAPGNYTVYVRDANLCQSTATTPVTILKPIALRADITTSPTCLNADGVVTLTASGGTVTPSYEYSKDGVSYGPSNVFSNLAPGAYTFYVRDTGTTCTKSVSVIIDTPNTTVDFTLSKTDVNCKDGSDGSISVSLAAQTLTVNNNPPYTYSLAGTTVNGVAVSRGAQSSIVFDNLQAGTYTITAMSSKGCSTSATIDVKEPVIITVPAPTVTPFGCTSGNAMNFATITVNGVTGGSATYAIYEFFKKGISVQRGASNVYTEADLAGGTYTVTVYDSKGCQGSTAAQIDIAAFMSLDKVNVTVNKAITCKNLEDITVTVTTTGGTPANLQYTLVDKNATTGVSGGVYPSQTNLTGVFTGLPVANYLITVRNLDTNCEIQGVHYVSEPNTFDLTIDNIVDVTCYGGTNGSANVTIIDRNTVDGNQAGAYSYTIAGPVPSTGNSATAGPLTLNNLSAGTYTITATLTNSPFCSVSKAFTINQPTAALKISETHTPITCAGNDGTISATAIGGWPGTYEFQLELISGTVITPWGITSNFTGLAAGTYIVKVRDAKTCTDQAQVILVNPTPIAATITVDKPLLACFGDTNAIITVQQPTGGSGNYKYTLETTYSNGTVTLNGPQASNVFTNLSVGSYRVSVSDTWSCSVWTNTVVVNQPTVVTANLVKTTAQTCQTPATLTLSATGGTGLYTYSTDPNFGTVLGSFASSVNITVPFTTVPAKYVYYVKDANGCSNAVSNSIDVIPLEPLNFTFEVNNPYINCLGDNNGKITASATGGLSNYVYTLLNGSGTALPFTPTQLTPGHFTQLPAGSYTVQVTSGSDCSISKPITITQPNTALSRTYVVTPVTCNGYGNGKIEITAQGGTGAIKFAISPDSDKFLDSGIFLNLPVGHYQTITQDERGCNFIDEFDITEPAPINVNVDPLSIKQEYCSGDKTGEFAITIGGGTAPYSTVLDDSKGVYVQNQVKFTGLSGGDHMVYVKDAKGCTFELPVKLNPAVTLNPEAKVSNDCVNDLPANKVTVTVDPSNILADVTYSLDNSGVFQISNVFTNLVPGKHFIMVQHKNGCIDATEVFPIDKVDPLTLSLSLGGLNEIVATVTGGSGVYQFTVNGESIGSNNKYIYFKSGNYTVTVTDSYGCTRSETKYFEFIDITIPPIFTPNGDGNNDNWKPTNTENYPDIKFIIYDRYGRQVGVFGAGQSWDGKYNGTELPMGDYWYILKLRHAQDDREFVGHFTLYR